MVNYGCYSQAEGSSGVVFYWSVAIQVLRTRINSMQ